MKCLIPSMDIFQCIHNFHYQMEGDPLWVSIEVKGEIQKLNNYIKSAIAKIRCGDLGQSIMNHIDKESYKQTTRREKLQNEMSRTKKYIHYVKKCSLL